MSEREERPLEEEHERPASGHREGGGEGLHTYQPAHPEAAPENSPGSSGYEGRDPKTEMPRVSSVPETQDEEQ